MNHKRLLAALLLVAGVCTASFWFAFGATYLGIQRNGQVTETDLGVENQESEPVVAISNEGTITPNDTAGDTGSKEVQLNPKTTTQAEDEQDGDDGDDDWTNLNPASLRWFPLKSRRTGSGGGNLGNEGADLGNEGGNEEYAPFFVIPEYPLGAIIGLAVCFAALAVFKSRNLWKAPR